MLMPGLMAEERGIKIYETKEEQSPKRYKNLINIKFFSQRSANWK